MISHSPLTRIITLTRFLGISARTVTAVSLSILMFLTQSVLAHSYETNIWSDRQKNITLSQSDQASQIARLPVTGALSGFSSPMFPAAKYNLDSREMGGSVKRVLNKIKNGRQISPQVLADVSRLLSGISNAVGTIRDVAIPTTGTVENVVLMIQDVHENAEAQKNIGHALKDLISNGSIGFLGLEGTSDTLNLTPFQTFPDRSAMTLVADYYLDQNLISGAVHAAMTAGTISVLGVDDDNHYNLNVKAVLDSRAEELALRSKIQRDRQGADQRRQTVFNKSLNQLIDQKNAYERRQSELGTYLGVLSEHVDDLPFDLQIFLEAAQMERSLDMKKVEAERKNLLEQLAPRLSPSRLSSLMVAAAQTKMGAMGQKDFYSALQQVCEEHGVLLSRYPAMDNYIRYLLLADSINAESVFAQMSELENAVARRYLKTQEQKDLWADLDTLTLAQKLATFTLTSAEWARFKTLRHRLDSSFPISAFIEFYRQAELRDHKMADRLLKSVAHHKETVSAVVVGGFHAEGIIQRLNQAGVAVVTFVPAISKIVSDSETSYLSVFSQQKTPLDKLFEGQSLFLPKNPAPPSLRSLRAPADLVGLYQARSSESKPLSSSSITGLLRWFQVDLSRFRVFSVKKGEGRSLTTVRRSDGAELQVEVEQTEGSFRSSWISGPKRSALTTKLAIGLGALMMGTPQAGAATLDGLLEIADLYLFEHSLFMALVGFGLSFVVGLDLAATYKKYWKGVSYNENMVKLVSLFPALVGGMFVIFMTIFSEMSDNVNFFMAFGLLGFIGIFSFRQVFRDPLDTAYMMIGLILGMAFGAGLPGTILIGFVVWLAYSMFMSFINGRSNAKQAAVTHSVFLNYQDALSEASIKEVESILVQFSDVRPVLTSLNSLQKARGANGIYSIRLKKGARIEDLQQQLQALPYIEQVSIEKMDEITSALTGVVMIVIALLIPSFETSLFGGALMATVPLNGWSILLGVFGVVVVGSAIIRTFRKDGRQGILTFLRRGLLVSGAAISLMLLLNYKRPVVAAGQVLINESLVNNSIAGKLSLQVRPLQLVNKGDVVAVIRKTPERVSQTTSNIMRLETQLAVLGLPARDHLDFEQLRLDLEARAVELTALRAEREQVQVQFDRAKSLGIVAAKAEVDDLELRLKGLDRQIEALQLLVSLRDRLDVLARSIPSLKDPQSVQLRDLMDQLLRERQAQQMDLETEVLVAPQSGWIKDIPATEGQYFEAGEFSLQIVSDDVSRIMVDIPATSPMKPEVGTEVFVSVPGESTIHKATVLGIEPFVRTPSAQRIMLGASTDSSSRNQPLVRRVLISVPVGMAPQLSPGQPVKVIFRSAQNGKSGRAPIMNQAKGSDPRQQSGSARFGLFAAVPLWGLTESNVEAALSQQQAFVVGIFGILAVAFLLTFVLWSIRERVREKTTRILRQVIREEWLLRTGRLSEEQWVLAHQNAGWMARRMLWMLRHVIRMNRFILEADRRMFGARGNPTRQFQQQVNRRTLSLHLLFDIVGVRFLSPALLLVKYVVVAPIYYVLEPFHYVLKRIMDDHQTPAVPALMKSPAPRATVAVEPSQVIPKKSDQPHVVDTVKREREEIKYDLPSEDAYEELVRELERLGFKRDKFSRPRYTNYSVYFESFQVRPKQDGKFLLTFRSKVEGDKHRYKARARYYDDGPVRFEIKGRIGDHIHKKGSRVKREMADQIIAGSPIHTGHLIDGFGHKDTSGMLMFNGLRRADGLKPFLYVAYEREAWEDAEDNRVTIDTGVRWAPYVGGSGISGSQRYQETWPGRTILELKFKRVNGEPPAKMIHLIRKFELQRTTAGKYVGSVSRSVGTNNEGYALDLILQDDRAEEETSSPHDHDSSDRSSLKPFSTTLWSVALPLAFAEPVSGLGSWSLAVLGAIFILGSLVRSRITGQVSLSSVVANVFGRWSGRSHEERLASIVAHGIHHALNGNPALAVDSLSRTLQSLPVQGSVSTLDGRRSVGQLHSALFDQRDTFDSGSFSEALRKELNRLRSASRVAPVSSAVGQDQVRAVLQLLARLSPTEKLPEMLDRIGRVELKEGNGTSSGLQIVFITASQNVDPNVMIEAALAHQKKGRGHVLFITPNAEIKQQIQLAIDSARAQTRALVSDDDRLYSIDGGQFVLNPVAMADLIFEDQVTYTTLVSALKLEWNNAGLSSDSPLYNPWQIDLDALLNAQCIKVLDRILIDAIVARISETNA